MRLKFRLRTLLVVVAAMAGLLAWERERAATAELDWQTYSPEKLDESLDNGEVVLVSLCATWTITTMAHESILRQSPELRRFVRKQRVILMRGDWTNGDPQVQALMDSLSLTSVPAFVVYSPYRPDNPDVLPEVYHQTEDRLRQAIAHAHFPLANARQPSEKERTR